jgi:hypothetical protein
LRAASGRLATIAAASSPSDTITHDAAPTSAPSTSAAAATRGMRNAPSQSTSGVSA